MKSTHLRGASFQPRSADSKLSRVVRVPHGRPDTYRRYALVHEGPAVAATYLSIRKTCPASCPFRAAGCYADAGFTRVLGKRLDVAAEGASALDVVRAEVELIDGAWSHWRRGVPQDGARGGRDLRLHVAGETPSVSAARALAGAAQRWRLRGGGAVWTYTHHWADIPRSAFGVISVLASVETPAQAAVAIALGYVPSLVVPRFPAGSKSFRVQGWRAIPCPAEVSPGRVTCAICRLCLDDGALRRRELMIAFALHGNAAGRAARAISGEPSLAAVGDLAAAG